MRNKSTVATIVLSALFVCTLVGLAVASPAKAIKPAPASNGSLVKRGEYLVTIGGCNDCHTPLKMGPKGPEPDFSRMLSGHPENLKMPAAPAAKGPWLWSGAATNTAFAGPWGISYAMNLTPDKNTGLGIWTEEMFIKTLRSGKHYGVSRPIMPPMPWPNISRATDEDLKAIYAYLRTIKPIENHIPDYEPPPAPPAKG